LSALQCFHLVISACSQPQRTKTHARKSRAELAVKRVSEFTAKERWPLTSSELNQLDYNVSGNVTGLSHAPPKTADDCWTRGNAAGDSLTHGTVDKAVKELVALL